MRFVQKPIACMTEIWTEREPNQRHSCEIVQRAIARKPQDFGPNAHFRGRFQANLGFPLVSACGPGMQIGTSLHYTDNAVQVIERIEGTSERFQSFTTIGLFQLADCGVSWGVGYEYLYICIRITLTTSALAKYVATLVTKSTLTTSLASGLRLASRGNGSIPDRFRWFLNQTDCFEARRSLLG